jgi:hypothetical protein
MHLKSLFDDTPIDIIFQSDAKIRCNYRKLHKAIYMLYNETCTVFSTDENRRRITTVVGLNG